MADGEPVGRPSAADMRLVIAASSAGTVFEWYDFFIYGTLAALIGKAFFPAGNATLQTLLVWAGFAVGFGFRPLGAVLFGFIGDRLGRKYTFLVTVTLMGMATAGVGLVPSADTIGLAAPALVLLLRIAQGIALGGEYGGAAIYVAEHAPAGRRGFYTGFIQASVVGGFVLSLAVVLGCKAAFAPDAWAAWGWRVPFLLSLVLLGISLWMRLKLAESPVFRAMRAQGELARNPFVESFTYPGNLRRLFVALFGISAGVTVIFYTSMFSALGLLTGALQVIDTQAQLLIGAVGLAGMAFFVAFGALSDRIGRKPPIVLGYGLVLAAVFPLFWSIGAAANPGLAAAAARAPVAVAGPRCDYAPLAREQASDCGKLIADLTGLGIGYRLGRADVPTLTIGAAAVSLATYPRGDKAARATWLRARLGAAGYDLAKVRLSTGAALRIGGALLLLMVLSGMTFGPVATLLVEMFPAHIRYSSMSIPYHIGTGYFGGFLPLIAGYVVARTGNAYAGLWYTWGVVAMAFIVTLVGLKGGRPRDHAD